MSKASPLTDQADGSQSKNSPETKRFEGSRLMVSHDEMHTVSIEHKRQDGADGHVCSRSLSSLGAYAAFQENVTGSFAVGKRFDAVIWDQDIMKVSPQEILRTRVLSTFVQGEEVYRNSA